MWWIKVFSIEISYNKISYETLLIYICNTLMKTLVEVVEIFWRKKCTFRMEEYNMIIVLLPGKHHIYKKLLFYIKVRHLLQKKQNTLFQICWMRTLWVSILWFTLLLRRAQNSSLKMYNGKIFCYSFQNWWIIYYVISFTLRKGSLWLIWYSIWNLEI